MAGEHLLEIEREGVLLLPRQHEVLVRKPDGQVGVLLGLVVLRVEGEVVRSLE